MRPLAILPVKLLIGLVVVATVSSQDDDPLIGDADLPNYVRLSDQIALAGQPTDDGLKKIQKAGFKTVMNFRSSKNASDTEEKTVEDLDLTYAHIPYDGVTDELVEKFSSAVSDPSNKPLFLHCGKVNIVSGLWYVHRVLHDGVPEEEAFAEAKDLGLNQSKIEKEVRDYVRKKLSPAATK